ncbi:MAG: hypothetical protein H7227_04275 [Actinobacteria bacterium]|nr:hypothetical protein [Actinomycetota bacterium]
MANDLLSTLKSYISKVADGEHTPAEVANSVNAWIKESTESVKIKVEEEVTRSVSKMGFIKRAEFDELKAELLSLKASSASSVPTASSATKAKVRKTKKTAVKKPVTPVARDSAKPKKKVALKKAAKPAGKVK